MVDPRAPTPAMKATIAEAPLVETVAFLPVLRPYVSMEVDGEFFLFVGGMFHGPPGALERLRGALVSRAPVEVKLVSADTLAGVFGPPVSAIALALDPDGSIGS